MIDLVAAMRWLLEQIGVEGVSAVTVLVLLGVWLYLRRASRWGRAAVGRAGSAGDHVRAASVLILLLLLLGVISADLERARELLQSTISAVPVEAIPWF